MSTEPKPTKQERREAARAGAPRGRAAEAAARRAQAPAHACSPCSAPRPSSSSWPSSSAAAAGTTAPRAGPRPRRRPRARSPGQKESAEMLAGIPQKGIYLGKPERARAPRRVRRPAVPVLPRVRAADAAAARAGLRAHRQGPHGVPQPVVHRQGLGHGRPRRRGGRASRTSSGTSPTSSTSTRARRTSGYVTQEFLDKHLQGRRGRRRQGRRRSPRRRPRSEPLAAANALADQLGVQSTPTILVGKRGGALQQVNAEPDRRRRASSRPSTAARWGRREPTGACASPRSSSRWSASASPAYLTYIHYEGIKPVCGLGGDCEKVQTSEWSELAGVPGRAARADRLRRRSSSRCSSRGEAGLIAGRADRRSRASASAPT